MAIPLTILSLLEGPELSHETRLVVDALRELLAGEPGPALHSFRAELAAERARVAHKLTSRAWMILGTTGTRRDGVQVAPVNGARAAKAGPLVPVPWEVEFPGRRGGAQPTTTIEAATLADAIAQVDHHWPMPAWWTQIDGSDDAAWCAWLTTGAR